jgi:hypothetical protein
MRESSPIHGPTRVASPSKGKQTEKKGISAAGPWAVFLLVFGVQFAFGMWMNSRGFLWNDALSRAAGALFALHSADPRLVAVGFVWMPLPSIIELLWVVFYPLWPEVASSGFASTLTTALAGGATAALLLYTARRLGLSDRLGWAFALVVAASPMLFLYAGSGMSEGFAAPFLTGAVCFVVLFWHSGKRRYVTAAGLALALGFASLYEAVPYGAALFAALALGLRFGSSEENTPSTPLNIRSSTALSIGLLLVPSLCVAVLWLGANAVVMDDPLFFATSQYSNAGVTAATGTDIAHSTGGKVFATLAFTIERTAPFLIPAGSLLLIRALDGRLWRTNTLSLVLLLLSVPFGLIAPLIYLGASYGWLRYFIYPLFVAAGWGLYEVVLSRHPRRASMLVMAGWIVAAPVTLWAMTNPALGVEEHLVARGFVTGRDAEQVGFDTTTGSIEQNSPVARYLNELPDESRVVLDTSSGWSVAIQASPSRLENLILSHDFRFRAAVEKPRAYGVSYFLVPKPSGAPNDFIAARRPALWSGGEPGFELVKSFPETPSGWRLYKVVEQPEKERKTDQ